MKRFIIKIIVFFLIIAVIDQVGGRFLKNTDRNSQYGDAFTREYITSRCTEDVIIMGSSRGNHHYDPQIISDSLKLSCFNCAYDALGILNMYGRYLLMTRTHTPKVLIYDVFTRFDIYDDRKDHLSSLDGIKQYANNPQVMSIFDDVAPMEHYKLQSLLYRYNTKIFFINSEIKAKWAPSKLGYTPLEGTMVHEPEPYAAEYTNQEPDSVKLKYMRKLIHEAQNKGTKVILCISPRYGTSPNSDLDPIIKLAKEEKVPLLNHYTDKRFTTKKEYFKDSYHLNHIGATAYTKMIASEIKQLLK
jgi:hypothetical protein